MADEEILPSGYLEVATDKSMAQQVNTDGSETQVAIDSRVTPIASELINSDPAIKEFVRDGVEGAVADLDLIKSSTPRVADIGFLPDSAIALTDKYGAPTFAHADPTTGAPTPHAQRLLKREFHEFPGVASTGADSAGVRDFTSSRSTDGAPDGHGNYLIRRRLHSGDGYGPILQWGDSLSDVGYGSGDTTPQWIERTLRREVRGRGVSGARAHEIGIRQGGVTLLASIAPTGGNSFGQIPADTSEVPLVIDWPTDATLLNGSAFTVAATILGVPVLLTKAASAATFTFHRLTAGTAVNVPRRTAIIVKPADRTSTQIIWAGRNNFPKSSAFDAIKRMVDSVPAGVDFLVVSVTNKSIPGEEGVGTDMYNQIMGLNAQIQDYVPRNFVDLRSHIIMNGLALAGMTPTATDDACIAADCPPAQLLFDGLHFNPICREKVNGPYLAGVINSRGY